MSDDRFALLEMDNGPRAQAPAETSAPVELDMVDGPKSQSQQCVDCGRSRSVNDKGVCFDCYTASTPIDPLGMGFASIAEESRANAAARRDRTTVTPTTRGVDDAVDSHVNDDAIANIKATAARQREAQRAQARAAAEEEMQSRNAERQLRIVAEDEAAAARRPHMRAGDIVSGAVAEGHGVIVGWRGDGDMTRAALLDTLARNGLPAEWAPEAASARAQAGRALGELGSTGYDVRAERKSDRQTVDVVPYDYRWTVGVVDHAGRVGDKFGEIVLVATLIGDRLDLEGRDDLCETVRRDYAERIGQERYRSSDVTAWLQRVLRDELDAVRFGVGWYVPRAHAATADTLCAAFAAVKWGADWISPALPVATSEQLRAGLLRGLAEEVDAVLHRLGKEREIAKTKEDREDIGPKRAMTFLGELKEIGKRVVAYGALLGPDRVAAMRAMIHDSVKALESSLSDDDAAMVQRFQNIWEELEDERSRNGGVL